MILKEQTTSQADNYSKYFPFICLVLIFTTFFPNFLHYRYFGNKIQLTEIIFLLSIPFIPFKKVFDYQRKENMLLCSLLLVYLLWDNISSILSGQIKSVAESFGRGYLFVLFSLLSYYFSSLKKSDLIDKVAKVFFWGTVSLGIVALYGYLMMLFNHRTPYLMFFNHYPYFGKLYRLRGPAIYPSLFISVITVPLVFFLASFKISAIKKQYTVALVLLFVFTLLTLSKSILLIAFAVFVFLLKKMRWLNRFTFVGSGLLFTFLILLFTHVIIVKKGSPEEKRVLPTYFTSGVEVFKSNGYVFLETDYLTLKKTEVNLAGDHLLFGVGTGNFNKYVARLKQQGKFPEKFSNLDPHCTYLGALVENGLFAFITLMAVFIYFLLKFLKAPDLLKSDLLLGMFLIYLTFLIDAIDTDILNFRHLWVFLALALVILKEWEADGAFKKNGELEEELVV